MKRSTTKFYKRRRKWNKLRPYCWWWMRLFIPRNTIYCYTLRNDPWKDVKKGKFPKRRYCPWHDINPVREYQDNGYCHYLGEGDWEEWGLLWDACKECGEREGKYK